MFARFFKAMLRFKHFLAIRRCSDKTLLWWSRQAVEVSATRQTEPSIMAKAKNNQHGMFTLIRKILEAFIKDARNAVLYID